MSSLPTFFSTYVKNSYRNPIKIITLSPNSLVRIAKNNKNRVQLVITNLQSNVIFLSPEPMQNDNEGLFRTAKRNSYVFSIFEDSSLTTSEWYARSSSSGTKVMVFESEVQM